MANTNSRDLILGMVQDIKDHQRPKSQLLPMYVAKRLNKQINSYYKDLLSNYDALVAYNEMKVMKRLTKEPWYEKRV